MSLREKFRSIFKKDTTALQNQIIELSVEVEELREIVNELKMKERENELEFVAGTNKSQNPKKNKTPKEIIKSIPNLKELAEDPFVTQKSVAEKWGVSQSNISDYCKRHDIGWVSRSPTRPKGKIKKIEQKVQFYFPNEQSFFEFCDTHYMREICQKLEVGEDTLRKYLKEKGHKRPSKGAIRRHKEKVDYPKEMPTDFAQWGIVKVLDSKGRAYYEKILQSKEFLTREGKLKKISELTNYDVQYIEWYLQLRGIRY